MERHGGGAGGRRESTRGAPGAAAGPGLLSRVFGNALAERVRRRAGARRLRELPDFLRADIGLATRDASARFRRP